MTLRAEEKVSSSSVQFGEIVKAFTPTEEDTTAYQFSNGRRFKDGPGAYEDEG